MKLHVLIYNGDLNLATFVYKLGEHLTNQGHEVTFMGHSNKAIAYRKAGIRYYPLPFYKQTTNFFANFFLIAFQLMLKRPFAIPVILKTIRHDYYKNKGQKGKKDWVMDFIRLGACKLLKPDLVHNQNSPALAALEPLFDLYPIVQSLTGKLELVSPFYNKKIAKIYKEFYPKIKGFRSSNKLSWKIAKEHRAKTNNVFVSYALSERKQVKRAKKPKSTNNRIKILSVGKFIFNKGFLYSLESMSLIKKELDFRYKIIGGGSHTEMLFHIEDLDLQDQVELVQNSSHEKILQEIYDSDLFLLPSVLEGFATVVTEAMTLCTPVISTTCSGMPELLEDRVNALLVPPRDPKAIANTILSFSQMPTEEIAQITANAQAMVKERLLWEDQIHNYIRLYENALN